MSKKRKPNRIGGTAQPPSCYVCLKQFSVGEQATRLVIPGSKAVNLCNDCAAQMQREYPQIQHLGHIG